MIRTRKRDPSPEDNTDSDAQQAKVGRPNDTIEINDIETIENNGPMREVDLRTMSADSIDNSLPVLSADEANVFPAVPIDERVARVEKDIQNLAHAVEETTGSAVPLSSQASVGSVGTVSSVTSIRETVTAQLDALIENDNEVCSQDSKSTISEEDEASLNIIDRVVSFFIRKVVYPEESSQESVISELSLTELGTNDVLSQVSELTEDNDENTVFNISNVISFVRAELELFTNAVGAAATSNTPLFKEKCRQLLSYIITKVSAYPSLATGIAGIGTFGIATMYCSNPLLLTLISILFSGAGYNIIVHSGLIHKVIGDMFIDARNITDVINNVTYTTKREGLSAEKRELERQIMIGSSTMATMAQFTDLRDTQSDMNALTASIERYESLRRHRQERYWFFIKKESRDRINVLNAVLNANIVLTAKSPEKSIEYQTKTMDIIDKYYNFQAIPFYIGEHDAFIAASADRWGTAETELNALLVEINASITAAVAAPVAPAEARGGSSKTSYRKQRKTQKRRRTHKYKNRQEKRRTRRY